VELIAGFAAAIAIRAREYSESGNTLNLEPGPPFWVRSGFFLLVPLPRLWGERAARWAGHPERMHCWYRQRGPGAVILIAYVSRGSDADVSDGWATRFDGFAGHPVGDSVKSIKFQKDGLRFD